MIFLFFLLGLLFKLGKDGFGFAKWLLVEEVVGMVLGLGVEGEERGVFLLKEGSVGL